MGYYDGHTNTERRYKEPNWKKRSGFFIAGIAGAILGASLVLGAKELQTIHSKVPNNYYPSKQSEMVQAKSATEVDRNIPRVVQETSGAVVGVTNIQAANLPFGSRIHYSGNGETAVGTGSGVIYKKDGDTAYAVTNYHVVQGAKKIEVTLHDGTKLPAFLLGGDIWTDLAVLKFDGKKVNAAAVFGNSDYLKPGESVIAIGNPLGPAFSGSVTKGIISGLKRTIPIDIDHDGVPDWQADVLQTDAAINPGNSGGALINLDGRVIGINSMKIARQSVEGIGFSIPINSVKPIIKDLEKYGRVKRPFMGVDLKSIAEIPVFYQQNTLKLPIKINYGAAVNQVMPGSPAAQAGLKGLDVIVELDGKKIKDAISLRKQLYQDKKEGDQVKLKFYRDGILKETSIKLSTENR